MWLLCEARTLGLAESSLPFCSLVSSPVRHAPAFSLVSVRGFFFLLSFLLSSIWICRSLFTVVAQEILVLKI